MRAGIVCLILGYVLSQFYRAFLAVLTPVLTAELGATAEDLAAASGLWFLAFALMQIPVGEALDRIGPRRTTAVLLVIGGAGGDQTGDGADRHRLRAGVDGVFGRGGDRVWLTGQHRLVPALVSGS